MISLLIVQSAENSLIFTLFILFNFLIFIQNNMGEPGGGVVERLRGVVVPRWPLAPRPGLPLPLPRHLRTSPSPTISILLVVFSK